MDVCPITKSRKEKVDLLIDLFLVFLPLPKHFDFPRLEFKKLTSQLLSEPLLNQDHTFPIMHPLPNQVLFQKQESQNLTFALILRFSKLFPEVDNSLSFFGGCFDL